MPSDTNKKTLFESIKDLERYSKRLDNLLLTKICNTMIPMLYNFLFKKKEQNAIKQKLSHNFRWTLKFCKNNPEVFFAEKGNITVALDKDQYIDKVEELLSDDTTKIDKNPITKMERDLNSMIKNWFQKGFISKQIYFSLRSSNFMLPC